MRPWIKILLGLFLGIAVGLIVKQEILFLKLLGNIFLDLFKVLVSLIVFASVVLGIYHIYDPKKLQYIGFKTLLCITLIAITFGLVYFSFLELGMALSLTRSSILMASTNYSLLAFIISLIPVSPIASFAGGNILQIIVFSTGFSYAIILSGKKVDLVLHVIESFAEIMYSFAHFIMKFIPYGISALIATAVRSIDLKVVFPLGKFLVANYITCFLRIFLIFRGSTRYLARFDVIPFFKGIKDAIILAFTSSSGATLLCVRNYLGVPRDIFGFVLSLGSIINMNGSAIRQATATYFVAQALWN